MMNSRLMRYVERKFLVIAEDLMENPQGLKFKLEAAVDKLSKNNVKDALGHYIVELKTLIRMIKMWLSRRYSKVSKQTIIYSVLAVIYFVTPTDFVPDFILGLGFVDDMAVITWVLSTIKDDLTRFKEWELEKDNQ